MVFLVLAWRYGFFFSLSKILSAFFSRSLGMGLVSSHDDLSFKTDFLFSYFRWREEGATSVLGIVANHLASIFFLPLSGDSLGLLYVPVPHSLPIRSKSTNICWFPFWPGFVTWGIDLNSSFNGQSLAFQFKYGGIVVIPHFSSLSGRPRDNIYIYIYRWF